MPRESWETGLYSNGSLDAALFPHGLTIGNRSRARSDALEYQAGGKRSLGSASIPPISVLGWRRPGHVRCAWRD